MIKLNILPSIRTNNFEDLGQKIISHWNNFLKLNLSSDIVYAIYFNYDYNYKGNYDFSIGITTLFSNSLPFEIPDLNFKIFSCKQSELLEKWKEIWELEENNKLDRIYKVDFEKHYGDGTVDIYISVK